MATTTVNLLPQIATPVGTDRVSAWDVSAGTAGYIELDDIITSVLTGGGVIATGGYTFTIPATMTAAGRNVANTFTKEQSVDYTDGTAIGLLIDAPASPTADAMRIDKDGTAMIRVPVNAQPSIQLQPYDNGSGLGGLLTVRENNNATTPAAGAIRLYDLNGMDYYLWVDATGDLRIGTSAPTNANDTSGSVVGSQS